MSAHRRLIAAIAALTAGASGVIGASGPAAAAPAPAITHLAGSAAPFAAHARPAGDIAGSGRLTIQVWLRPRTAAAERFATTVSTPGNPEFHRYLSPGRYAARFGPRPGQAAAVAAWLRSRGFTGVRADPDRSYVRATASVGRIDAALRIRLRRYRPSATVSAWRYPLRANDRPVSVPAALAGSILGVTGLDNAAPVTDLARPPHPVRGRRASPHEPDGNAPCSHYYGQHVATGLPRKLGTTKFPTLTCGYSARQLRGAYGVTGTGGAGQTIALTELGLTRKMFLTLRDHAAAARMPAPSPKRYAQLSLGRGSTCGDPFDQEEQLDVESSYDMAPAARQLVVGGDSCDKGDFGFQGLFDAVIAILDGNGHKPLASIVSNSWGTGFDDQPGAMTDIEHAFLVRAAAEGVGMYLASGDIAGPQPPADDPFAISVGGTSLGLGKAGQRLFETGWSDGFSVIFNGHWQLHFEDSAASGGPSLLWPQPAYQRGVVPASMSSVAGGRGRGPVRSAPDISADADAFTGYKLGLLRFGKRGKTSFFQEVIGGTSLAAPLVAGLVADAQHGQRTPFGFADPALYKLAGTSALFDPLPLTSRSPLSWRALLCPASQCGEDRLIYLDDMSHNMGATPAR